MKKIILKDSRTFEEFLLAPGLTKKGDIPENVSLKTPLTKFTKPNYKGEAIFPIMINIPFLSAIMQAVSNHTMAIALAKLGGLSFIYCSQPIEDQCLMVEMVKKYKAGFVISDSNLKPTDTLATILQKKQKKEHSTMAVTENGEPNGKFLGLITSLDYDINHDPEDTLVSELMTPKDDLVCGDETISLTQANEMIRHYKKKVLPIVTKDGYLKSLVFRKDIQQHANNRNELLDENKRLMVGAGVDTWDYKDRIPALIAAGADVLCIDSSHSHSEYAKDVILFVREKYGNSVKIGVGNIVTGDAFNYLAKAGADFIKVGIGGGAICITREEKAVGRGQATAIMDVADARDKYFEKEGIYIPICSDGGISQDSDIALALAMGANSVMMGRFFARCEEAPGQKLIRDGKTVKEYWGEGSNRARNIRRYSSVKSEKVIFEEGVDGFVPFAGSCKETVEKCLSKIISTFCTCGCITIPEFQENTTLELVSFSSIKEGKAQVDLKK